MRCLIPLIFTPALGSVDPSPPLPSQITPFAPNLCLDFELVDEYPYLRSESNLFVASTDERIPGFLGFDTLWNEFYEEIYMTDFHEIDRAVIGETIFDVRGRILHAPTNDLGRTLFMHAGPQSTFATRAGSFLLNPINNTNVQIVVAPSNATEYAYQGAIYYANISNTRVWRVPISIGIVGEDSTVSTPQQCEIKLTSRSTTIPFAVLEFVFRRFQQLGIDVHWGSSQSTFFIRSEFSASLIDQLPVLNFRISSNNENLIQIAELHPRDYLEYGGHLFARVSLESFYIAPCSLSLTALRRSLIHFDSINHRIGFGDPLNEI